MRKLRYKSGNDHLRSQNEQEGRTQTRAVNYKVHGLQHMLFCLLSILFSLGSGEALHSSSSFPTSSTLYFGASAMRPPQEGLGFEERILSPLLTKSCQRLTRPRPFHRQCPALGPKLGAWLPAKDFPFPRGRLPRRDGHLGTTFLMSVWLHILLISLSVFSYGVSVSFLAGFVTLLHFCLFLIIWPNTLVFIWFFFPSDFWHIRPVAHFAVWYATLCVCFV